MNKQSIWDNEIFRNQYKVSKTLRFELIPQGKTEEFIKKNNFINSQWIDGKNVVGGKDKIKARHYKIVKEMMNEMHRLFIGEALRNDNIKKHFAVKDIVEAYSVWNEYRNKENGSEDKYTKKIKNLSGKLKNAFNDTGENWKNDFISYHEKKLKQGDSENKKIPQMGSAGVNIMFKKNTETIQLLKWKVECGEIKIKNKNSNNECYTTNELLEFINTFENFNTYLSGFNKNRANVYNIKEDIKSDIKTSISNRIFQENMDFFFENIFRWEKIKESIKNGEIKSEDNTKIKISDVLKTKKWDFNNEIKQIENSLIKQQFKCSIDKLFSPDSFLKVFSQTGIDLYNQVLGGLPELQGGRKVQGVNEIINLTKQKVGADRKRFPVMDVLYKQILSKSDKIFIDAFEDDEELLCAIDKNKKEWFAEIDRNDDADQSKEKRTIFNQIIYEFDVLFKELESEEDKKNDYFLSMPSIEKISAQTTGGYNTINNLWKNYTDTKEYNGKIISKTRREKLKKQKYLSFANIEFLLNTAIENDDVSLKKEWSGKPFRLSEYVLNHLEALTKRGYGYEVIGQKEPVDKESIDETSASVPLKRILESKKFGTEKDEGKDAVKAFLDSCNEFARFIRLFIIKTKDLADNQNAEESSYFQSRINTLLQDQFNIITIYNKARNYLTRKMYSDEKIKLNFENVTLADGWDRNKEESNLCLIFIRDNKYYLGVMDKNHNQIFRFSTTDELNDELNALENEIKNIENKLINSKIGTNSHMKLKEKRIVLTRKLEELNMIKPDSNEDLFLKVNYKYFPQASKMIPKCSTQLNNVVKHFNNSKKDYQINSSVLKSMLKPLIITKEIYDLNNIVYDKEKNILEQQINNDDKRPKKFQIDYLKASGDKIGYQNALKVWIEFCMKFLQSYESTSLYDYSILKKSRDYSSLDEFYTEIDSIGYTITLDSISKKYIDKKVESGELYLFQIYNKDFSDNSRGKNENLHTGYWRMLFDERNLRDVVVKLNGKAELYFRPASIDKPFVHKKGHVLKHKKFKNEWVELGSPADKITTEDEIKKVNKISIDNDGNVIYENHKIGRVVTSEKREIIKDKRFTSNKYIFHCPITLNFKAREYGNIDFEVQKYLAGNPDVNIIGIDRGEKHLLYYSVINQQGVILEQGSLNTISNMKDGSFSVNYQQKLHDKEIERDSARKAWQTIENIKELKAGYLSQVVHKLANLIIHYNAIVVLEDLNIGFKRGRFKVEKQVYQKFERALIEKLNYLVFKDREFGQPGHYLSAYQLTSKFTKYQELGKQAGILFYTAASYTSKADPVTGYMQNIYHQYGKDKTKDMFNNFESIIYNGNYFEFTYDLKTISSLDIDELPVRTLWTVCSNVVRSRYVQKNKTYEIFNVNEELEKLFKDKSIELIKNSDLIEDVCKQDEKFIKNLYYYFSEILKMRVIDKDQVKGTDKNDYILSPVYPFYNSKQVSEKYGEDKQTTLPINGDSNGAYNIARKGKIILDKITLRQKLKDLYSKEDIKLEWDSFKKSLINIKDTKKLINLFNEWIEITGRKKGITSIFLNNDELSPYGEQFCRFVGSLSVDKNDWQNYSQRLDVIQSQFRKYGFQSPGNTLNN